MIKVETLPSLKLSIIQPIPGEDMPADTRLAASILGTMLFPFHEEHLQKRVATAYVLALRNKTLFTGATDQETDQWAAEMIATRGQLIQLFRFLELSSWAEVRTQWERGLVAGEVLSLIVAMIRHDAGKASLKKAKYLAEQIYRFPDASDSSSRRLSQKTIDRIWSDFWTVSHLWAGFAEMCRGFEKAAVSNGGSASEGSLSAVMSVLADPGPLIAYATNYLRCVTNHIPPQKKPASPIILWSEAWLLPHSAIPQEQPEFFDPAKLYTGLSERAATVLANYKHD